MLLLSRHWGGIKGKAAQLGIPEAQIPDRMGEIVSALNAAAPDRPRKGAGESTGTGAAGGGYGSKLPQKLTLAEQAKTLVNSVTLWMPTGGEIQRELINGFYHSVSGEFLQINRYLVEDLQARGLWTDEMRTRIKTAEGSVQGISELPEQTRLLYRTVWELPMRGDHRHGRRARRMDRPEPVAQPVCRVAQHWPAFFHVHARLEERGKDDVLSPLAARDSDCEDDSNPEREGGGGGSYCRRLLARQPGNLRGVPVIWRAFAYLSFSLGLEYRLLIESVVKLEDTPSVSIHTFRSGLETQLEFMKFARY